MPENTEKRIPAAVDERYINLVSSYVRKKLPEDIAKTLLNDDPRRMYEALVTIKNNVESQLADKKSRDATRRAQFQAAGDDGSGWIAYKADDAEWRSRAVFFLISLEKHISATKERIRNNGDELGEIKADILHHMEEIDEDEASDADKQMWRHVGYAG